MNNFNFKKIFSALDEIKLTNNEKNSIRLRVSQHMHQRPVQARPSYTFFRYFSTAALVCVVIIGSGGFVAYASQSALPGQTLYPVKRTTEELRKLTIKEPSAKATYELALIDKRFSETNQLISEQSLTAENESIVIETIKKHTDDFKQQTAQLAMNDPAEALSYNTKLTNSLKTGTHILLAVSDQQTISTNAKSVSPNTLVLAAYATAEKVSLEKKQLETMIVSDSNIATIKTAEKRYVATLALLSKNEIKPTVEKPAVGTPTDINAKATTTITIEPVAAKISTDITTKVITDITLKKIAPVTARVATVDEKVIETPKVSALQLLADKLQSTYNEKKYGQVIVIADEIEQLLNERTKIEQAEKAYNVTIPATDPQIIPEKTEVIMTEKTNIVAPTATTIVEIKTSVKK